MSGGRRKHSSKWDLKEESQLSYEKVQDSARPGKAGISFYERESRSGRFSPRAAGYNNGHKWSAREADDIPSSRHDLQFPSREPLRGSRGSRKDDRIDDYRENFKATTTWDEDENYDMKTSIGLDDWRQQIPQRSPRNDWNRRCRSRSRSRSCSRNRSRSPVHELRQESRVSGRNRGRPGVSAQLCKDFAAGRCRRGSHCHFFHHSIPSYDDSWDSRHKQAGAPKYSTPHDSSEYPMRGGRNREGSLERGGEHESCKSGNVPCKFFAAGNCRNGKYCRFSHSGQALVSPNRRSRDETLVWGHNSDDTEKVWHGPKWSDATTFADAAKLSEGKNERMGINRKSWDDRLVRNHNSDDVEKLWDGPTWSSMDISADASKLCENLGPRFAAWSPDGRLPHTLDENTTNNITAVSHEEGGSNKMEALQSDMKNAVVVIGAPESGGTDNWLGDMEMSPEWNYPVKPSSHAMNEDHGHITRSSQSLHISDTNLLLGQGIIREASGLLRGAAATMEPMNEDHGHITRSSQSLHISDTNLLREQVIIRESSGLLRGAAATMEPMILDESFLKQDINQRDVGAARVPVADKNAVGEIAIPLIDLNFSANILPTQNFDQNGQSSSALPSSLNPIGQNQGAITSEPSRGGNINNPQNLAVFQVAKTTNKPSIGNGSTLQFGSGIQLAQTMVSSEQLTQLSNLSASLVQILGNGQQLPQLYAALNSHNVMQVSSSANSEGPIAPNSAFTSQPNEAIRPQNQYDPSLSDSFEQHEVVNPPGFFINPSGQKSNADGKPNDGSENCKVSEISGGLEAKEDKKAQIENMIPQEKGEVQKTDGDDKDDKTDEGKKSKDTKGIRAFKFALAEFIKELLKPTWKEGQINKDVYKNIVKKVVDKVIGTMQGTANIPQTQEKIDQYLSFSKSKLTKLVQAYVEKLRKG